MCSRRRTRAEGPRLSEGPSRGSTVRALSYTVRHGSFREEATDPAPWRGRPAAAGTDPSLTEFGSALMPE